MEGDIGEARDKLLALRQKRLHDPDSVQRLPARLHAADERARHVATAYESGERHEKTKII